MKTSFLFILFMICSCSSLKNRLQISNNVYYFYFDAAKEGMIKYPEKRNADSPLKFLYFMDNTANIIFISRNEKSWSNPERIKIKSKDTTNLNLKYRSWLNNMTNDEKYSFFYKRENKVYHLIEKDTLNGNLYLIKDMGFSEEIE